MKAHIRAIAVFNEKEARFLPEKEELKPGLNIITGESKTGKSAILDIIDWCLGNPTFVIPKGKITDFASIYCLLLQVNSHNVLIARQGEFEGKDQMYVKSVSENFDIKKINLSYFKENEFNDLKTALKSIEKILNLISNEPKLDFHVDDKPSILRSIVPFLFQNQDTIKDKRNLFYPKVTKSHFPILAGWVTQKYYELEESLKKIKKKIKTYGNIEEEQKEREKLIYNFITSFNRYYDLIGMEIAPDSSLNEFLKKVEDFPNIKNPFNISNKSFKTYSKTDKEINDLVTEKTRLSTRLSSLLNNQTYAQLYKTQIKKSEQRIDYEKFKENYQCPVCLNVSWETNTEVLKIKEAEDDLKKELKIISKTAINFTSEIEKLTIEIKAIDKKIEELGKIKTQLIKQNEELEKFKSLEKIQLKSQAEVELRAEQVRKLKPIKYEEYKSDLRRKKSIEEQLKEYTFNEEYKDAAVFIKEKMETIVAMLDFEYNPPNLYFDLIPNNKNSYKLSHNDSEKGRMYLNQIGSASNALACHIGLFVSFLSYFASEENSKVPSILFLDQPSQVYFPSLEEGVEDNDTKRVKEIYETLETWIDVIEAETGIKPQIIVADHIKNLGSYTKEIQKNFVAEWRGNKKFI